jgi:hypothetical protein
MRMEEVHPAVARGGRKFSRAGFRPFSRRGVYGIIRDRKGGARCPAGKEE